MAQDRIADFLAEIRNFLGDPPKEVVKDYDFSNSAGIKIAIEDLLGAAGGMARILVKVIPDCLVVPHSDNQRLREAFAQLLPMATRRPQESDFGDLAFPDGRIETIAFMSLELTILADLIALVAMGLKPGAFLHKDRLEAVVQEVDEWDARSDSNRFVERFHEGIEQREVMEAAVQALFTAAHSLAGLLREILGVVPTARLEGETDFDAEALNGL